MRAPWALMSIGRVSADGSSPLHRRRRRRLVRRETMHLPQCIYFPMRRPKSSRRVTRRSRSCITPIAAAISRIGQGQIQPRALNCKVLCDESHFLRQWRLKIGRFPALRSKTPTRPAELPHAATTHCTPDSGRQAARPGPRRRQRQHTITLRIS